MNNVSNFIYLHFNILIIIMANFDIDYHLLKNYSQKNIFSLSSPLQSEIIKGGLKRYKQLYRYFLQLIDKNLQNRKYCKTKNCYNRYFLKELNQSNLTRNDFYLMTYMILYFIDLLRSKGYSITESYYVISQGHKFTIMTLQSDKMYILDIDLELMENYQGYLLSVLYYLLPDFKYEIKID